MPVAALATGVDVHYELAGSGEPVLLVMGTGADHTVWAPQVPAYAERLTVVTYDQRGTGRSAAPADPAGYSTRVLAEDAAALLDALGIDSAHVAGLSLGSAVAQELALGFGSRVRSLSLHCTWGRTDAWLGRLFETMAEPVERGDLVGFARAAMLWVMSPAFHEQEPDALVERERAFAPGNPSAPPREGLLGHLHADRTHDALDRLHLIEAPTLVTTGELDWQVPARYGRAVHERIEGSRFHVFTGPRSSHCAFAEMPEEWNAVTLAFLAEHAG